MRISKKLYLLLVLGLLLAIAGVYYYSSKPSELNPISPADTDILFEKFSGGEGNCSPNSFCNYKETLYFSGELVKDSPAQEEYEGNNNKREIAKKQLTDEQMAAVKDQIKKSGIMEKSCISGDRVYDYFASYTLNFGGQSKKISFPNCEEELRGIEKLIF